MTPLPLRDHTRRMAAPEGWNHETQGICGTLEIFDTPDGRMVSAWQPSPAELQRLSEGEPVILSIQGTAHPVVSLSVADGAWKET
jgi:hypothetical protein